MRRLTQQINRLDDKLDEQKHIAERIEQEVILLVMSENLTGFLVW